MIIMALLNLSPVQPQSFKRNCGLRKLVEVLQETKMVFDIPIRPNIDMLVGNFRTANETSPLAIPMKYSVTTLGICEQWPGALIEVVKVNSDVVIRSSGDFYPNRPNSKMVPPKRLSHPCASFLAEEILVNLDEVQCLSNSDSDFVFDHQLH